MAAKFRAVGAASASWPDVSVANIFSSVAILAALRIDNIRCIAKAYGEAAALESQQHLEATVQQLATMHVVDRALGRLDAVLIISGTADAFTQQLRSVLARSPARHLDNKIFLTVSSAWSAAVPAGRGEIGSADFASLHGALGPVRDVENDPAVYRRDMRTAAAVFAAAETGCLFPAWQPVRGEDGAALYYECLLRLLGDDTPTPGEAVAALERLGLVRAFDQMMLSLVIDELEADGSVRLAVNISAESAVLDGWWDAALRRLGADRDLAKRLVIEITETAAFPSISHAVRFTSALRDLGCRIAIDDFGMGFSSLRSVLALSPDYVKVDAFFLHRASLSAQNRAMLAHLIGLAGTLAAVIVEGVETQAQSDLVASLGAPWQQGHHLGFPSTMRPWLSRSQPKAPAESMPHPAMHGFASVLAASAGAALAVCLALESVLTRTAGGLL